MSGNIVNTTDANFEADVLQSDTPGTWLTSGQAGVRHVKQLHLYLKYLQTNTKAKLKS